MECPELNCPEVVENTIPMDFCCPPDPCNIQYCDILGGLKNLLPPGKAWDDCCGDGNRSKFLEAIAKELHLFVSEGLCCVKEEFDACGADKTIECWSDLYGVPADCIDLSLFPEEDHTDIIKAIICAFERIRFGSVPNACFFVDIAAMMGIDIEIHAPGITNQTDHCCFYSTPSEAVNSHCSTECGGPVSSPSNCTSVAPVMIVKMLETEEPVYDCPPKSNSALCKYPKRELLNCILELFAPAHLYYCIV